MGVATVVVVFDPSDVRDVAGAIRVDSDERLVIPPAAQRHAPADVPVVLANSGLVAALPRRGVTTAAAPPPAAATTTTTFEVRVVRVAVVIDRDERVL